MMDSYPFGNGFGEIALFGLAGLLFITVRYGWELLVISRQSDPSEKTVLLPKSLRMTEERQWACIPVFMFLVGAGLAYVIGVILGSGGNGWSVAIYALFVGAIALFVASGKDEDAA